MYHLCAEVDRTSVIDALDDIFLKIQKKLAFVSDDLQVWYAKKNKIRVFKNEKVFFRF